MLLPDDRTVLDLSRGGEVPPYTYAIGRYDERRPGVYSTELFSDGRELHIGIDLFGPVGTPLHAFAEGEIFMRAYNAAQGDYGYTLITRHEWEGRPLYALYGHLAARSVVEHPVGLRIKAGDIIAWVGDRHENGGWPPHVHFQLSWEAPSVCDMPGVVRPEERAAALERYPDPRLVLGPIY